MLLQIPVFIALYNVLYVSIELRHASFLYIPDLSAYDPYYISPILMGASMFLQQQMTPAMGDPKQAQTMIRRDDKLDKQYRKLFRETLEEMRDDQYIRRATYLLWVGHDLERIGDRATNIAERVIFMTTGQFVENIPTND